MSGMVRVGICNRLPVKGIAMIIGNDLVGGKVTRLLEVCQVPMEVREPSNQGQYKEFPVCAVTHAQARKCKDVVGLAKSGNFEVPYFS